MEFMGNVKSEGTTLTIQELISILKTGLKKNSNLSSCPLKTKQKKNKKNSIINTTKKSPKKWKKQKYLIPESGKKKLNT